jgi:hypothetical protein
MRTKSLVINGYDVIVKFLVINGSHVIAKSLVINGSHVIAKSLVINGSHVIAKCRRSVENLRHTQLSKRIFIFWAA